LSRAVIFDWDGTLADTRQVIVTSFQQAVQEVGIVVSAEFIERRIGTGAEQTFREILQGAKKPFDEAIVKKLLAKKIQAEISMTDKVKLFPGALELLEELQGKARVALASMNNRPVIIHLLNAMKIGQLFEVVLTAEEVTQFKPNPEIFLKCAAELRCKPEESVVVEDSIFGVQAARAAGMDCIAVLTGAYNREELKTAKPGLIVESLMEKEKILKFIFR
jgi:HAD superfamily hydrolase (TIGR01509 family)